MWLGLLMRPTLSGGGVTLRNNFYNARRNCGIFLLNILQDCLHVEPKKTDAHLVSSSVDGARQVSIPFGTLGFNAPSTTSDIS